MSSCVSAASRLFIGGITLEDRDSVSLSLASKGPACFLPIIKDSGSLSSGSSPVTQPLHV